jgi:hypothetical protein
MIVLGVASLIGFGAALFLPRRLSPVPAAASAAKAGVV